MATLTIADLDNGKRDLETVDAVANSQADTTTTRYGQQTLTLAGALRRLGWQAPVPYASGLSVSSSTMTVERDGIVYRPDPALVPFTTGAWNPDQWRVVQNTEDSGLVYQFDSLAAAQAAAANLPEGAAIIVDGQTQGRVASGFYVPDVEVPAVRVSDYAALRAYRGNEAAADVTTPGIAGRFYRRGVKPDDGVLVIKDFRGRSWERDVGLFDPVNVQWAGAVPDDATDISPAIERAKATGRLVYVPAGKYVSSTQFIFTDLPGIYGDKGGATVIRFHNVSALDTKYRGAINTVGLDNPAFVNKTVPYVADLVLKASGTQPGDFNGVQASYRTNVQRTSANSFSGIGHLLDGVNGNANATRFDACVSNTCNQGFIARGSDGNAGTFNSCVAINSTLAGFYDSSLYGNTYIACESGYGGTTAYGAIYNSLNSSTYIGCYAEHGTTSGAEWQLPACCVVISPSGAIPKKLDNTYRNSAIKTSPLRGWCFNDDLTFEANFDAFTFGSATKRAAKVFDGGVAIRGIGDGAVYQLVTNGANAGGSTAYPGVTLWKDNTPLMTFGHPSGRVYMLSGVMANLPNSPSGLPSGTIWFDPAAGNTLKIVG